MEIVLLCSCGQKQVYEVFQSTGGSGAFAGDLPKVAEHVIAQPGLSLRGGNPSKGAWFGVSLCSCRPNEAHVGQQEVGTRDRLEVSLHAQRRSGLIVPQSQSAPGGVGFLEEQLDLAKIAPSRIVYKNIPSGVYMIEMRVDGAGWVAEQREDDNVTWLVHKRIYVGPPPTGARTWTLYR